MIDRMSNKNHSMRRCLNKHLKKLKEFVKMLNAEGREEDGEDKTVIESNASWRVQGVANGCPLLCCV